MKNSLLIVLLSAILTVANAQTPTFEYGQFIYDGTLPVDVGLYSSPFVYDWNGDGKKDLVTGQFTNGNIRYYENWGDELDPVFNGFAYLQASGAVITLPYG